MILPGFAKTLLEWLFFAVILAVSVTVIQGYQTRTMLSADGSVSIPPQTLPRLDGGIGQIKPHLSKPTLIYFFAPWCSICRLSVGKLGSLDAQDAQVFVIALDYASTSDVEDFVRDTELELPVYLGNSHTRDVFKIEAYPSYYVLDQDFRIVARDRGVSTGAGVWWRLQGATADTGP